MDVFAKMEERRKRAAALHKEMRDNMSRRTQAQRLEEKRRMDAEEEALLESIRREGQAKTDREG
jgi:hypothetical protein